MRFKTNSSELTAHFKSPKITFCGRLQMFWWHVALDTWRVLTSHEQARALIDVHGLSLELWSSAHDSRTRMVHWNIHKLDHEKQILLLRGK